MTSSHNPVSLNDYKQQMKAKLVLSRQIHTALPHARPYITRSESTLTWLVPLKITDMAVKSSNILKIR